MASELHWSFIGYCTYISHVKMFCLKSTNHCASWAWVLSMFKESIALPISIWYLWLFSSFDSIFVGHSRCSLENKETKTKVTKCWTSCSWYAFQYSCTDIILTPGTVEAVQSALKSNIGWKLEAQFLFPESFPYIYIQILNPKNTKGSASHVHNPVIYSPNLTHQHPNPTTPPP